MSVIALHLTNREVFTISDDRDADAVIEECRLILQEDGTFVIPRPRRSFHDPKTTLAERVKQARKARGWGQQHLATLMDRSVSWVSQIERGLINVDRVSVHDQLLEVLGLDAEPVTPDALLDHVLVIPASSVQYLRVSS